MCYNDCMFRNRTIKNFNPAVKEAKKLAMKRIKAFIYPSIVILLLEIIAIALVWSLAGVDQIKVMIIVLATLHLLALVTFFVIFDMGPANKLKKDNFKLKDMSVQQGHTFYYALKMCGLTRLIINIVWTSILIGIVLVAFLI